MSKVVKAVVGVAVATVGIITGNPLLIAQGTMMTLGAVLQKSNAGNKATTARLSKKLEPEDFRKIIFGRTMAASDLRYWETWGSKYTNFDEVIAVATHTIQSYQETYIEEELVSFSGGRATGTYAGALSVAQTRTGGHLAAGGGSLWAASAKMTGVPHYVFKWVYDEKKLPQGIPSRYTRVVEGAPVYDPRRDSTRGGSGPHRADNQSTWAYATADSNSVPIGRNNALQMLWYLIGWRINSKLVAGRGLDLSDIDFASFIAAANDAEAQEYYTDMILSTGDSHSTNEDIIAADGLLGELLDSGGYWSYRVTRNDVAEVSVALDDDDVLEGGQVQWVPFRPMSDKYNEVAGTFVDPAPTSLYQPRAYPTVSDTAYYALDGYRKRKTQNFQCVQNAELAQRLARLLLNRARYAGEFTATFNLRALRARVWDIVWLSLERFGFQDKPFRVVRQAVSAQGVDMVLREEDASVYSNGTVVEQVPPSAGAKYDPRMRVALAGLSLASGYVQAVDGTTQDALIATWLPAPSNVRRTEVQYKLHSDADATHWMPVAVVAADAASAAIAPVVPNTEYDVSARHISVNEVPGPWASVTVKAGDSTRSAANRVTYLDGGNAQEWKPDDKNATRGAPKGSLVGEREAEALVRSVDFNATSILAMGLSQEQLAQVVDARTLEEGQTVKSLFLNFRNSQTTANTTTASTLALIGGKTADGTAFNLNLDAVRVAPNKTLSQRLSEIGAVAEGASVSVSQLQEAVISPDGVYAKAVMRVDANGAIAGLSLTSDGTNTGITFVANELTFVDPNGGKPIVPFQIMNGVVRASNFEADRIKAGAIDFEFEGDSQSLDPYAGWQDVPGGLIMQFGRYRGSINDETSFSIVFPKPFPRACLTFVPVPFITTANNERDLWLQALGEPTRFGAAVYTQAATRTAQKLDGFNWVAFGK